jgi:hypothetical protein
MNLIHPLPKNVLSNPESDTTTEKPRLLFVSTLPCEPSTGGKIQFYRHLVESNDFHMDFVQEHNVSAINYLETGFAPMDACLKRGIKTRFFPDILATNLLMAEWRRRNAYLEQARTFQPDAIVTVAYGSYSLVAASLARRLGKPLITFFHDWWPDLTLCRGQTKKVLDYKFRRLYRESTLALCVSDTMQQELGPHPNAPVLYPIPGPRQAVPTWTPPTPSEQNTFKVVYLGQNIPLCNLICMVRQRIGRKQPWQMPKLEGYTVGPDMVQRHKLCSTKQMLFWSS